MAKTGRPRTRKGTRAEYMKEYMKNKKDSCYTVYYLPEEHYVGYTNRYQYRLTEHKYKGRNVEGAKVLSVWDNPYDAHIHETQLHKIGCFGFNQRTI